MPPSSTNASARSCRIPSEEKKITFSALGFPGAPWATPEVRAASTETAANTAISERRRITSSFEGGERDTHASVSKSMRTKRVAVGAQPASSEGGCPAPGPGLFSLPSTTACGGSESNAARSSRGRQQRSDELAAERERQGVQVLRQLQQVGRRESLRSVAQRLAGVVVDVDHHAVGPCGNRRTGHGGDELTMPHRMRRVHDHGEVALLPGHHHPAEVQRVPGGGL